MRELEELTAEIEIAAPPTRVWTFVSDVRRMAEWSPQVQSTRLSGDVDDIEAGTRFTNLNAHDDLEWTTHGEVVRFVPERELAFRIDENWVIWSFALEPTSRGGTRLRQRREAPDGISDLAHQLVEGFMGGHQTFGHTMRAGMRETLQRLKQASERALPEELAQ